MWIHVVLGHSATSLLVLITLRGRWFEPSAAAMEAHMRDLSTALGFSSHVGVTTWSQRNFGTLYMVTSPAYQALL
jgi:hypothetical protein